MRITSFFSGLLLFLAAGHGATYYVDFEAGSNSNAGTSESTAWKHCPGDSKATDKPRKAKLAPGDTVKFKGGIVYEGRFQIRTSGETNNVITFDGNYPETWGKGRAVLDGNYVPAAIIDGRTNVSHITIRGFEIRNAGGYSDTDPVLSKKCDDFKDAKGVKGLLAPEQGTGIQFIRGENSNLRFEHLFIHRCGQWRNTQPFRNTSGFGISLQNVNGVVIQDCEITKTRVGISVKATQTIENVEIANVKLHDYIVWCIDVAPRKAGAVLRNITIRDSVFYDYHQHDKGNWTGCGEKPHTDGIFLRTAGMASTWENVKIFNCDFYADRPGKSEGGTASIYVSQGPSVLIYNCTFRSDRHTRSINVAARNPAGMARQVVRIYNNSFLFSPAIFLASETNRNRREVYIQNNILVRSGGANLMMINLNSGVAPVVMDNNVYWDPNLSSANKKVFFANSYRTFGQTKGQGREANGAYGDPRFADMKSNPPSRRDLRVTNGSAAINRGANLSKWFTEDRLGKPRPATGPWTCGAFEFP